MTIYSHNLFHVNNAYEIREHSIPTYVWDRDKVEWIDNPDYVCAVSVTNILQYCVVMIESVSEQYHRTCGQGLMHSGCLMMSG